MLETLADRKLLFINYLEGIDIDKRWKAQLTDEKSLGIATQVYLFYPECFWGILKGELAFEEDELVLDKLCIAGYLYFISLIIQDKIIDTETVDEVEKVLQISWLQEECIRILMDIFPLNHSFWTLWNKRRNAYFSSVRVQKKREDISFEEYKDLSDNKSAFGKVAIDCCYSLFKHEKNKSVYEKLINSHTWFSVGAQLLDDIRDLDEDFKSNQISYALLSIKGRIEERNERVDLTDLKALKKYLYTSGLYIELLTLADECLNNGLKELEGLKNAQRWKGCFMYEKKNIFKLKSIFAIFTKELYVKTHYSHELTQTYGSHELCLERALAFLFKEQDPAGSWTDMVTNAGFSNIWTTGFVLSNINGCAGFEKEKGNAVGYLLRNKAPSSLWGYSEKWDLTDADSSTNVLIALLLNNRLEEDDFLTWTNWFIEGKGFTTYNNTRALEIALAEFNDFSGWTQAHPCVSALALNLLSLMPGPAADHYYKSLKHSLLSQQNDDGLWDAYWWTSSIYSSCYIAKALLTKEPDDSIPHVTQIINAILLKANADRSFGTAFDPSSVFYTALVLDTLCTNKQIFDLYRKEAEAISLWIMQNQYSDGSFPPSFSLRIPAPNVLDPSQIREWATTFKVPVNVVKKDVMRFFSTSLVCNAMNKFLINSNSFNNL